MKTLITILLLFSCSPQQDEVFVFAPVANEHKNFTSQIVNEINEYREVPVTESDNQLTFYLAYKHSERGVLDHEGNHQRTTIIAEHTPYQKTGEVVGYGYNSPQELVYAWINSEMHLEAVLKDYKYITIAKHGDIVTALFLK